MLRLENIKKSYTTAGFTQNALDGISVAFRDNEFAAILGPSGSGKTTMLNIIGGLDRYESGELEIDGISTKNYKAGDWDTYRNNRIGFVFQSYNLIPHQNVLANVELALTLSGVPKWERRRRAMKALREVGLSEHARKKPGQLSGGQMQRVAIARALINDPEILLADEPTGALDSTTGLQVMELLTKIAEDRLVIMVTHNNELAEEYANRIVHLKDGKVISDSRPFDPSAEMQRKAVAPRRASMSFLTAVSLSLSNLMTKKGRTFTTAFAGSIGIIGIALIMAFSNGINEYIRRIEEDTLSVYPLSIQEQTFDLSGFFGGHDGDEDERRENRRERPEGTVREVQIMEAAFSSQSLNDLASLKAHIDRNMEMLEPYVTTVQYTYDITPQIFLADTSNGADRVHPDSIFSGFMGGGDMSAMGGMGFMPGMPTMNIFHELPNEPGLYLSQYEVLAGRWPESFDEAVLVLQFGNRILDFTVFSLGIRDRTEMQAMLESVMQGSGIEAELSESEEFYTYDRLMGVGLKVVNPADMYHYDSIYEVWVDKSSDDEYMIELLAKSMDLKITGIVQPDSDAQTTVLSAGVNYTPDLILHLIDAAEDMPIVKAQMANPEVNVISGNTFAYEDENPPNAFDFSRIISVDEDTFRDAVGLESMMNAFDFSEIDLSGMDFSNVDLSGFDMSGVDTEGFDLSGLDLSSMDMSEMDMSDFDMSDMDFSDFEMGEFNLDMSSMPAPDFGNMLDMNLMMQVMATPGIINTGDMTAVLMPIMAGMLSPIDIFYVPDPLDPYAPPVMPNPVFAAMRNYVTVASAIPPSTPEEIADALEAWENEIEIYMDKYMLANPDFDAQMAAAVDMPALSAAMGDIIGNAVIGTMDIYMTYMAEIIAKQITEMMEEMIEQLSEMIAGQIQLMMETMIETMVEEMTTMIEGQMQTMMGEMSEQISGQMESVMSEISVEIEKSLEEVFTGIREEMEASMEGIDGDALAEAFMIELSEDAIYELMTAMLYPSSTSYEKNLSLLGYADTEKPTQINIYPLSFDAKNEVLSFLDAYNSEMERTGQTEKVIHFTDIVGLMMSSVTDIVDIVSYALIAFVSVALVVSSIMIGVITFVSVLERKKEIGILRAVGASKGNIRLVFNAETLIIGFVAGVIGVIVTTFLIIIANAILLELINVVNLVIMPSYVPALLVATSMFLTFIAGLIPASAAASKPPVEALRSE